MSDALFYSIQLSSRPSVRGVPDPHGLMKLVKRHRTIYFGADNSSVSEQNVGNKEHFSSSRCDAAAEHVHKSCASSSNLPRTPALSGPGVPASQVSSGVDVQPRSTSSSTTR